MLLDVRGCLVSIDAMDCQTEIASKIVDKGGDYLLAVNGASKFSRIGYLLQRGIWH